MVEENHTWSEIAGTMKKSERQVKYQWCYLLSERHSSEVSGHSALFKLSVKSDFQTNTAPEGNKNDQYWSADLVCILLPIFPILFLFICLFYSD